MKGRARRWWLPLVLAALYLTLLLLGAYCVCVHPAYRQRAFFTGHARAIAREHLMGVQDDIEALTGPNVHILLYGAAGERLRYVPPTLRGEAPDGPGVELERYLPAVLRGEEVFAVTLGKDHPRRLTDIMVVAGAPMVEDGRVLGGAILVKNLLDLPDATVGYVCYFTVFFWAGTGILLSGQRRKRKLEQLRRSYLENAAHALKTPVASIKALAETLCDEVESDPDRRRLYCAMILQQANRQSRMVRDVLELSKLQSGGARWHRERIAAAELLAPVLEKYGPLFDYAGIALHAQDLSALPELYTDRAGVEQIFGVLLDNALKFVREGGCVWLEAEAGRERAVFRVRDDGPGIAPEDLPHVFERFYKRGGAANESGSGLGLAIARETAAGLGERLWAESAPGRGAVFSFTVRARARGARAAALR